MTTTRSLLCDAVTAGWISWYRQRLNRLRLTSSSRRAERALRLRWSVGRTSKPFARARATDALRRRSESDWQTTRVLPGLLRSSAEDSERIVGTAPPAQGLTEQSGAGSGQYAERSTWAAASAGTSSSASSAETTILFARTTTRLLRSTAREYHRAVAVRQKGGVRWGRRAAAARPTRRAAGSARAAAAGRPTSARCRPRRRRRRR